LNTKFGATDASNDLYIMEQFHDYKMADNRSVVEQAHEIQTMAKELELLKCVLPDKFVARCILQNYLHLGGVSVLHSNTRDRNTPLRG
ncbi:hypothetical protein EII06_29515, partial [Klebsiella pneumoniae]|nr:hypothetical protein [Klebsiella pneumoniae]